MGNQDGLHFDGYSTVTGSIALRPQTSKEEAGGSVEVWLQPRRLHESGTVIAFYNARTRSLFSLNQSLSDLELRFGSSVHFYLDDAFRRAAPMFITITSGAQGTAVYIDGAQAKNVAGVSTTFSGDVVVGDSPGQSHNWSGRLFGIAIYQRALAAPRVLRHYQSWTQNRRPQIGEDERNIALYLFNEHRGSLVHNRAGAGTDLHIPEKYVVLDQTFLEPIWKEFEMSRSYWASAIKNIVGFIPLGFCFCLCFSSGSGVKRSALFAVFLGSLVSLTIEVLQAYLPTRDSGTSDLITNTLGTWVGVGTYRALTPTLSRAFPWLVSSGKSK